ncbi:MAG: phosphatase PAP2 family protein [Gemmatimonadaceae bacterium]
MRARPVLRTAALIVALAPSLLPAQSVGRMLETDFRNFGGDVWAVWTSPFRAGPKDWLTAGLIIGASAAASPLDDDIDRWMVRHKDNFAGGSLKELREGGLAFSGKYITPVAAGALVYALATKNTKIQEGIFGCLASYASGSVVRNYVIYPLISRRRPSPRDEPPSAPAVQGDQYQFEVPGEFNNKGQHSLPAGHAANIISCASFLNNRFEMGFVEPALYLVSAGVGVGRLADRRHWNSDTMVGMAFGYAIGRQIAHRSLNRAMNTQGGVGSAAASVLSGAYLSPSKSQITVGWKTTF